MKRTCVITASGKKVCGREVPAARPWAHKASGSPGRPNAERVRRLAQKAAERDRGAGRAPRPQWWVGEYGEELGVIDVNGRVDYRLPAAQDFMREYQRAA